MIHRLLRLAACLLMTLDPASAAAPYGYGMSLDASGKAVVLVGDIEHGSAAEFERITSENPAVTMVMLDSPGGSLMSGLAMADLVFERKMATYVPKDAQCASACSFVFFAGRDRLAEGNLGVHQFYGSGEDDALREDEVQIVASEIIGRLNRYGTAPGVLTIMFATLPDDMHFFSADEISKFGIDHGEFVGNKAPVMASARSGSIATYPGAAVQGTTIGAVRLEGVEACARTCAKEKACGAFTFYAGVGDAAWPNCHLKSEVGFLDVDARATAGMVVPAGRRAAPSPELQGIDPTSAVYRDVLPIGPLVVDPQVVDGAEACRVACVGNAYCTAFSFETVGGQCNLMSSVSATSKMRGFVSGVRSATRLSAGGVYSVRR